MAFKIKKALPAKEAAETTEDGTAEGEVLEGSVLGRPEDNLPGVESVDRVVLASENAFDWIHRNRKVVIGAVVLLVVGMLVVAASMTNAREKRGNEAQELYRAYMTSIAPVGENLEIGEDLAEGDPSFKSMEAQLLATRDITAQVIGDAKGGPAQFARLLNGAASVRLGGESATENLQAFEKYASTPLQTTVAEIALSSSIAADGDLAAALERLDALAASMPELGVTILEQRAGLVEAFGTEDAALTAWRVASEAAAGSSSEHRIGERVALLELQQGKFAVPAELEVPPAAEQENE